MVIAPPVVNVDVSVPDAEMSKIFPSLVATATEPPERWITKELVTAVDGVDSGANTHCVFPEVFNFHTIVPDDAPPIVTLEVEPSAELKVIDPLDTPDAITSPALLTSTDVMSSKFEEVTF